MGEKSALYSAFISFLGNHLLIIAIPATIYSTYYSDYIIGFSYHPTYGIIYGFWFMYLITMWKRKSTEITFQWGLTDMTNDKTIREDYLGDEYCKNIDLHLEKHSIKYQTTFLFLISLPINIFMISLVILVFYLTNIYAERYKNEDILKYLPNIIKSIAVTIAGFVNDRVSLYFTNLENHKYQNTFEKSIILKIFSFRLVSDLVAIFYSLFFQQNFENLKILLYSLILVKMGSHVIVKYFVPYATFKFKKFLYFNKIKKSLKNAKKGFIEIRKEIMDFWRNSNEEYHYDNIHNNNNNNDELDMKNIKKNNAHNKFLHKEKNNELIFNKELLKENKYLKFLPRYIEKINIFNMLNENKNNNNNFKRLENIEEEDKGNYFICLFVYFLRYF